MALIYFLRSREGYVKIGRSGDHRALRQRMTYIQSGNPCQLTLLRVIEAEQSFERDLHCRFRAHGIHGEWFHYTEAMMGDLGRPDAEGIVLGPIALVPVPGSWSEAHIKAHQRGVDQRQYERQQAAA